MKSLKELIYPVKTKQQLNENFIHKIVASIFSLVLSGHVKTVINNINNDPELIQQIKKIEEQKVALEQYL